jgi:hypothetical protein
VDIEGQTDDIGVAGAGLTAVANVVWNEDATGHQTLGTFGQAIGDPVADSNTIFKAVVTDAAGATVGVDVVAVQADTDNIQTRLPAALVGGRMDSDVAVIQANVITATSINADAITAGKIADGAIDAATFAAGAITATVIATGAIDADALATDAVTEIRSIVSGTADSGTTTTMVDAARTEADTDYWKDMAILFTSGTISGQARLITAFNAATDTITFSPATTQAVGTNTYEIIPNVAAAGAAAPSAEDVATAVWNRDATSNQTQGSFGQAIGDPVADTNTIYKAVVTDAAGATIGVDVVAVQADTDDIQAKIGTPSNLGGGATLAFNLSDIEAQTDDIGVAGAGLTAIDLPDQTMNITGNITGNLSGSVGSVTAAVTVGTINANVITASSIAVDAIGASELAADAVAEIRSVASGTADSGSTTTMVDAARTEADTDYWRGSLILFTSGTIAGQSRYITAFDAATDTITFAPATTQAVGTNTYEILPTADFLRPTTTGRTLDVSAGGEAGLDWANIGSPTTAQNLSATNIDVDQIVASVSGAVGSVTGSVGSVTGAVGSVTAGVTVAVGGIGSTSFAAGAIDSAAIAADAIGASELAADAIGASELSQAAANKVFGTSSAALPELAQATPSATPRPDEVLMLLYMALRNASQSTSTERRIKNDAGTVIAKATMSDNGTTFDQGELVAGP